MTKTDQGHVAGAVKPDGSVADAPRGNWVDALAPAPARPFLRLSRADRPIGTWLLLLPCWWAAALAVAAGGAGATALWVAAGCAAGALLMRGAGCTWNDVSDREFDAAVARTRSRPIPSGQVSVRAALIWMAAQALVAFAILLTFHPLAIGLGIASLALVAVYPFAKRFTWWPQVFLGLAFNWGALLAWAAVTGALGLAPLLLYAAGIAWTLHYDTIYAFQDIEDDATIGVRSTARRLGADAPRWLAGFSLAAALLMAGAVLAATTGTARLVALAGVLVFALHLLWQLRRLDLSDPGACLALFRLNRNAGLLPVPFFAAAALL